MRGIICILIVLISMSCKNECLYNSAYSNEMAGNIERATSCYKNLLGTEQKINACNRLINIYSNKNQLDSVIKYREIIFRSEKNNLVNTFELGNLNFKRGKIIEALNYFMMVQRIDSSFAGLHYNLAVVHLSLGAYSVALQNIRTEISQNGNEPKNQALLGQIYLQLNKYPESLIAYTKAIEGDTVNDNYHFLRAIVYYYADSLTLAVDDLKKCLILNKNHANALELKIEIGIETNDPSVCPDIMKLEQIQILSESMEKVKERCN